MLKIIKKEDNLAKGDTVDKHLIDDYICIKEVFLNIINDSSAP